MKILAIFATFLAVQAAPSQAEAIRILIQKNIGQIQACYNQYIKEKSADGKIKDAKGQLTIEWEINQQGKASNFNEKKTSFDDKHVFSCVAAKMATWDFPPPTGKIKTTVMSFPFVFDLKK
jgi:hypothetical protein